MNWPEACVYMVVACCIYGSIKAVFDLIKAESYCDCDDEDTDE